MFDLRFYKCTGETGDGVQIEPCEVLAQTAGHAAEHYAIAAAKHGHVESGDHVTVTVDDKKHRFRLKQIWRIEQVPIEATEDPK